MKYESNVPLVLLNRKEAIWERGLRTFMIILPSNLALMVTPLREIFDGNGTVVRLGEVMDEVVEGGEGEMEWDEME